MAKKPKTIDPLDPKNIPVERKSAKAARKELILERITKGVNDRLELLGQREILLERRTLIISWMNNWPGNVHENKKVFVEELNEVNAKIQSVLSNLTWINMYGLRH